MWRLSRRSGLVASGFVLAAVLSCGRGPAGPGEGAGGRDPADPPGWAFPRGSAVRTVGTGGMVSTTDRVASEIGTEVLRRGGNAVDAAVATFFALAVVNPEAGNLGGGGFMVVRTADGETAALDFREKAPLAASRDMFMDERGEVTADVRVGHLASGVPGSVAGMWAAHERFGTVAWADLVEPAVNLADGLVVHERLARSLEAYEDRLRRYPATADTFLVDGDAPRVGDRLVQRDLAQTLRRVAADGRDGFYRGRTAALVEAEMERGGGIITTDDLVRYEAVWREPVVFGYRGYTVTSMPPPSSGGVALAEMLNILEGYDLAALGYLSVDHAHLWAEAAKRAFVDRNAYLADPDFVSQPVARLVSDDYAAERREGISWDRATPAADVAAGLTMPVAAGARAAVREGDHTTHYSVVDGWGSAVAVTTTINSLYGSLVTVDGAGFLLNNEMDDFTAAVETPNQFGIVQGAGNAIEPEKRMLSSMSPTVLLDPDGRVELVTGTPGGPTIITTVAQILSNVVDFGMDVGAATSAPRLHHQHLPDVLSYEPGGLSPEVVSALRLRGHTVEVRSSHQGDAQSILVRPDGTLTGVADPRRGGAAAGVREPEGVP